MRVEALPVQAQSTYLGILNQLGLVLDAQVIEGWARVQPGAEELVELPLHPVL